MTNLPSELNERPTDLNVANARLPESYESARQALSHCYTIDECQEWANKAEAIASYARMADDDTLYNMARRIQGRAVRRVGELLQRYNGQGQRTDIKPRDGDAPKSQKQAATDAGMSERQRKTAVRVAKVPADDFEKQIESDTPPSVTKLADQGKKEPDNWGLGKDFKPHKNYAEATKLIGQVGRFAEFCNKNEPEGIAEAVRDHEVGGVRQSVATIDQWLDRFVINLRGGK